jgi:hypothetical protein
MDRTGGHQLVNPTITVSTDFNRDKWSAARAE